MSKKPFEQFINKPVSGAKKKEAMRQEKRKIKAEARAQGEERRRMKLEKQRGVWNNEQKPLKIERRSGENTVRYKPSAIGNGKVRTTKFEASNERPKRANSNQKPNKIHEPSAISSKKEASSYDKPETQNQKPKTSKRQISPINKWEPRNKNQGTQNQQPVIINQKPETRNQLRATNNREQASSDIPLNKFIAHAGVCGRREAAELVKTGHVIVNGNKIIEPGFKVSANDKITVKGKQLFLQKNLVYILVNKPKDYITTTDDPQGRKTILDLIKGASPERVYPVGRLDRNTTGVLLLTNDGELAQKLTHPSYEIKKLYEVKLDKPLTKSDFEAVLNGVTLEDGLVKADALAYADTKDKSIVGIEIHSGRNRIVRRIFEHLGYDVKNLDRVMFANLTKKNVERGKWRFLQEKEVRLLKFMNQSFVKIKK